MADTADDLRERFKRARVDSGLSQEEVAERLGMSTASVSRKERGDQPVTARDVEAMESVRNRIAHEPTRLGTVSRGTWTVGEAKIAYGPPDWMERRIDDTLHDMAQAGATKERARYIKDVLRSSATLKVVLQRDDGSPRSQADQEQQLDDLLQLMWLWVQYEPKPPVAGAIHPLQTPGAAPIAPVYPTGDPTAASQPDEQRRKKK
jgi:transcriptional regulator with XRE-family HTH domain